MACSDQIEVCRINHLHKTMASSTEASNDATCYFMDKLGEGSPHFLSFYAPPPSTSASITYLMAT